MFRKFLTLAVPLLLATAANSNAQLRFFPDSLHDASDSLRIFQDRNPVSSGSLGNYAHTFTNSINMQTYAGFNISNTLRGLVPNLDINADIASGGGGLRYNNSMLLIDGIPFASGASSYYNLNSFEYQSISAISSGNQMVLYGGAGSNGAFVLESKNGKGLSRPFFEANSSTSYIYSPSFESSSRIPLVDRDASHQWALTNSAAYAQDYGKVDLRVSYTNTFIPEGSETEKLTTNRNAVRINAGLEASPRFSMRLIADSRYVNSDGSFNESTSEHTQTVPSITGNLYMKFVVSNWLMLSSQGGIARTEFDSETKAGTYLIRYLDKQSRDMINVLATMTPRTNERLRLTFVTGGQIEKQGLNLKYTYQDTSPISGISTSDMDAKVRTWLAQGRVAFSDVLFADLNYRLDYFKDASDDEKVQPHYSVNTSFDFAKAFSLETDGFSAGRVRFSAGKFNMLETTGFPIDQSSTTSIFNPWGPIGVIPNPGIKPTSRNSIETGADLSFLNSQIVFNATYFNSRNDQTLTYIYRPGPGGGLERILVDIGALRMEGWEFALGAYAARKENLAVFTKLIYGRYQSFTQPDIFPGHELDPALPNWTASVLGQIELKRVFGSLLLTHQKGGEQVVLDSQLYPYLTSNQTQMWLQDVSVGYKFSRCSVSLSGRNLWKIIDKREDYDFTVIPTDKVVTASITVKI